ncbi:hypothetical protein PtB15_11B207 [Puccinia triticina]|nr:hypothetical protein PtB15_11B207 [Puccinia triticina]
MLICSVTTSSPAGPPGLTSSRIKDGPDFDFIALASPFHGTYAANVVCPLLEVAGGCLPGIWQMMVWRKGSRTDDYSPSLAGERDRGSLAVEVDDTMIRDTQEEEGDPEENNGRFRTETTQLDPFAAPFSTPPRRGGIFFSPPRSLDTLTAKRTQSEDLTHTIHRV